MDGIAELKKVLDYVGAMHLKETNGKFKTWHFPAFGEGIVNFKEVFRLLNERKFYGPFTMEIEGIEGENLTREQAEARVEKSVEHLRTLGCIECRISARARNQLPWDSHRLPARTARLGLPVSNDP